jgi:hypothetical protein
VCAWAAAAERGAAANACSVRRIQLVNATVSSNFSAGVW